MIRHTVQKGDSLWKIAKMHDVSLEALIAANPQLTVGTPSVNSQPR